VLLVHGMSDAVANPKYAARVAAKKLHCPLVLLPAAHWVVRECRHELSALIMQQVRHQEPGASRLQQPVKQVPPLPLLPAAALGSASFSDPRAAGVQAEVVAGL
jgi:hypothetical protein